MTCSPRSSWNKKKKKRKLTERVWESVTLTRVTFSSDTFPRGVAVEAREVHLRVKTMTVRKARIGNGSMDDKKKTVKRDSCRPGGAAG